MKIVYALGLSLLLGACVTEGQNSSYRMTQKEQAMYDYFISQGFDKNKATIYALNPGVQQTYFDDLKCQGYGSKPGSNAYVTCRAQLEAGGMKPAPVVVQPSASPSHCTSVPLGSGMVSTNCY